MSGRQMIYCDRTITKEDRDKNGADKCIEDALKRLRFVYGNYVGESANADTKWHIILLKE